MVGPWDGEEGIDDTYYSSANGFAELERGRSGPGYPSPLDHFSIRSTIPPHSDLDVPKAPDRRGCKDDSNGNVETAREAGDPRNPAVHQQRVGGPRRGPIVRHP